LLKSLPVACAALFLIAGCVSVGPEATPTATVAASAGPSLGVTTPAPPTQAPTVAPTVAPTPTLAATPSPTVASTPTVAPTLPPTALPSSEPTPGPSGGAGDRDLIFSDDMSDSTSGWDTLEGDVGSISYDTGFLAFRYNQEGAWSYTVRDLDTSVTTLVQAGDFYPDSKGYFGLLCGMKSSGTFFGAITGTTGGLVFIEIDNGVVSVLERHDNQGLTVNVGDSNPMALECSSSIDGVVSMIVGLSNTGPVAVYRQPGGPIDGFDITGIYGEAGNDAYVLGTNFAAAWGAAQNGQMSEGAQTLFEFMPSDLQNNCYESPVWNTAATYVVTCLEQVKGKGAEVFQYHEFDDNAALNAAYQDLVTAFGVESTGSCKTGPNETTWSFDSGDVGGRVQCAPQTVGVRFDWTDDETNIEGTLVDLDGDYGDVYDQWVNGGPFTM
jgi:hypothetical protein